MSENAAVPRFRLGILLWMAGMLGVVIITATVLPQMLGKVPLPAPLWVISLASLAQSTLLVALAVWTGVALGPTVGLRAPVAEAAVTLRSLAPALEPQLLPGITGGLSGGILLFAVNRQAPAALAGLQERFAVPLAARILYGGITEELLLRWGFMTVMVWLGWRFLQQRRGAPSVGLIWVAITVSALLFGAGHLPAASVLIGTLDVNVVTFVIGVNAGFGMLFGYLFWRFGLESAMLAHGLTHLVNHLVSLF